MSMPFCGRSPAAARKRAIRKRIRSSWAEARPRCSAKFRQRAFWRALFEAFSIEACAEITCECNPGALATPLARALGKAGVNRLSIGAQASQERLLRLIGRIHDWQQVIASVEIARNAGFDNINLDLMFGLPLQTAADMRETLAAAIALRPTHLSCYGLIVEEGTPLSRDIAAGKLALPEEEIEREMYELARRTLAEHGYEQYEISNFAREGYECRHNIGCWTRVPYLGFGCAAHGFFRRMPHDEPVNDRCVTSRARNRRRSEYRKKKPGSRA